MAKKIAVIGSVNLDIVATAQRLPVAGETVTDAVLNQFPGGKGANQALAARRLGADVELIACVGDDDAAQRALSLLREGGVDLARVAVDSQCATGTALIAVAESGENQIVVAPGANRSLDADQAPICADALIGQLEVPVATLVKAVQGFDGFTCVNLAPAMDVPASLIENTDLVIVNETEAAFYAERLELAKTYVVTRGAAGASMFVDGIEIATSAPPAVDVVDTTGAGDTFTAALTLALVEGRAPQDALMFACAAAALSTTAAGAQPSLPMRADVDALIAGS